MNPKILKYGFLHAAGAALYVMLIAVFMTNVPNIVGKIDMEYLGAALFLMVFVISAATMGMLVFGRPVLWYLNGAKQDAVYLAFATIGFLVVIAVILLGTLVALPDTAIDPYTPPID